MGWNTAKASFSSSNRTISSVKISYSYKVTGTADHTVKKTSSTRTIALNMIGTSQEDAAIKACRRELPDSINGTSSKTYSVVIDGHTLSHTCTASSTTSGTKTDHSSLTGNGKQFWCTAKYHVKASYSNTISGSRTCSLSRYGGKITAKGGKMVSGSTTFSFGEWPNWKIKYSGNGSTSGSTSNQTKWQGEKLTLKNNGYKKKGYHDDGYWHGSYTIKFKGSYTHNNGASFHPEWTANTYYIDYQVGSHPGSATEGTAVSTQTLRYDTEYTVKSCTWTTPGYTFSTWRWNGKNYNAGTTIKNLTSTHKETLKFVAQWSAKTFHATFYSNKGSASEPATFASNSSTTKTKDIVYYQPFSVFGASHLNTRERYNFLGWANAEDATTPDYSAGEQVYAHWQIANNNRKFYAVWKDILQHAKISNHIRDKIFRSDSLGMEQDDGTYLHINQMKYTPYHMRSGYYKTSLIFSYRVLGSTGSTHIYTFNYPNNNNPTSSSTATYPGGTYNLNLNPDLEYEIIAQLVEQPINPYTTKTSTRATQVGYIYTASYPIDIRSDEQMIGVQVAAPTINEGITLGGPTITKARDFYLDVDDSIFAEDEDLISQASKMGMKNEPPQKTRADAVMEIRDDGQFISFGKQTSNLITTKANNGKNKAYYGTLINDSDIQAADIYYDLNNSSIDKGFAEAYNAFNSEKFEVTTTVLPATYQQVPFIESDGTQWINSGYNLKTSLANSDTFLMDVVFQQTVIDLSGNKFVLGTTDYIGSGNWYPEAAIFIAVTTGKISAVYPNSTSGPQIQHATLSNGLKHTVQVQYKSGQHYITVDGTKSAVNTTSIGGYPVGNLALFGLGYGQHPSATIGAFIAMKLYKCQFRRNGTLVRNFIPCVRISDGKPGLYDTVGAQFYTNQGSGEDFTYGNDIEEQLTIGTAVTKPSVFEPIDFEKNGEIVSFGGTVQTGQLNSYETIEQVTLPSTYQQVEYIQTNGKNYINTGFNPTNTMKIFADVAHLNPTGYQGRIFGAGPSTYDTNVYDLYNNGVGAWAYSVGTTVWTSTQQTRNAQRFQVTYDLVNKKINFNGGIQYSATTATPAGTCSFPIFIAAQNQGGTAKNFGINKIWRFKIWNSGTLIKDYVPCYRISDKKVGLYDLVNSSFITPSGTGNLLMGPIINKKRGWILQKGNVVSGIKQTRDLFFIDYDLENLAQQVFHKDLSQTYGVLTFSRGAGTTTYGYEPGMKWSDFIEDTVYNLDNLYIENNLIYHPTSGIGYVMTLADGKAVTPSQTINQATTYCFSGEKVITFTIAGVQHQAMDGVPWSAWYDSPLNDTDLIHGNSYLYTVTETISGGGNDETTATTTYTYNYVSYNNIYEITSSAPVAGRAYVYKSASSVAPAPEQGGDGGDVGGVDPGDQGGD